MKDFFSYLHTCNIKGAIGYLKKAIGESLTHSREIKTEKENKNHSYKPRLTNKMKYHSGICQKPNV